MCFESFYHHFFKKKNVSDHLATVHLLPVVNLPQDGDPLFYTMPPVNFITTKRSYLCIEMFVKGHIALLMSS
jgi:hypothetical protein